MGKPKTFIERGLGNIGGRSLTTSNRIHISLPRNQRIVFFLNLIRQPNSEGSTSSEVEIYCDGTYYYMSTQEYASLVAQCGDATNMSCICDKYLS